MNGAALVHDFEIALAGNTSEDVDASLPDGRFGMAEETGRYVNEIAKLASRIRIGYGEAAGQFLNSGIIPAPYAEQSVLASAYKLKIPVTIHLAIGTDIPHMHPAVDPGSLGAATYTDFRLFSALVQGMHPAASTSTGEARLSSPRFFLRRSRSAAITACRCGRSRRRISILCSTTARCKMSSSGRPRRLHRVAASPQSHGYAITGHHEILLPLLAAALASNWAKSSPQKSRRGRAR